MSEPTVVEAEVVEGHIVEDDEPTELAVRQPMNLYGTTSPAEIARMATEQADTLMAVVRAKRLSTSIKGREHIHVEAWTFLGTMFGVFPVVRWSRLLEDGSGWEARVEAVTLEGQVVGAAEAMCLFDEQWAVKGGRKEAFAVRSMAQTRATSRALRSPLGFVAVLAGFDSTPAEERVVQESERAGGGSAGDAWEQATRAPRSEPDARPTSEGGDARQEPTAYGEGVAEPGGTPPKGGPDGPATTKQKQTLAIIAQELGWDDDERRRQAGVSSFTELTKAQAMGLIDEWKKLEKAAKAHPHVWVESKLKTFAMCDVDGCGETKRWTEIRGEA